VQTLTDAQCAGEIFPEEISEIFSTGENIGE